MSNYADENVFEDQEEDSAVDADDYADRNVLREALIKHLTSPAPKTAAQLQYEDDLEPPREIKPEEIAAIPRIGTIAAVDDLIDDLDKNIDLEEARTRAVLRAQKLEYLKSAERAKRCQHVKIDGETCGSAAMRSHHFCYHHLQAHSFELELPIIEDHRSLQVAFSRLAQQIATKRIDPTQAKLLIQILQSSARLVPAVA